MHTFKSFCVLFFAFLVSIPTQSTALDDALKSTISKPRFVLGDLDQDGINELVVGGRVGPYKSVTHALTDKSARVEVYSINGNKMNLKAVSDELNVVNDVTVADLDGDGKLEIVAVGDYRILILRIDGEKLVLENAQVVSYGRYRHVLSKDLDADGRSELIVSELLRGKFEEVPQTEIRFLRFDGVWRELTSLQFDRHVGDLCLADFDGDGEDELVLEQGAEEVGGYLSMIDLNGGWPQEGIGKQISEDNNRILSLTARTINQEKMLGIPRRDGGLALWKWGPDGFSLTRHRLEKVNMTCTDCIWHYWAEQAECK